ncbi:MAG: HTTM domain-containing protein [Alcanivorax sp.]
MGVDHKTSLNERWNNFQSGLFEQKDAASLAFFRIVLGVMLMHDALKIFPIEMGNYAITEFRPYYYGFGWVQANLTLITICVNTLPFAVFCVTIGLFYRIAMPITAIILTYMFLIYPEHYLNHYYMLILFCTLMSFIPANKIWSIDSLIKNKQTKNETTVPAWSYWLLKMQTEVILVYAGLVKINWDWLQLQPLGSWVRLGFFDVPIIGPIFFFDPVVAIGAYGVIILHVFGAPLLFWDKARPWVFGVYTCFHLTNSALFNIGIFPFMTIGATLLFFNPNWPRLWIKKLKPTTDKVVKIYEGVRSFSIPKKVFLIFTFTWVAIQIITPIPALFSDNLKTAWHGHKDLFAWRMMLNDRAINTAMYVVHIPQRRRIEFIPLRKYLSARQCTRVAWRPNMSVQFANYLEEEYKQKYAATDVRVHAYILLAVNFREPALWADPTLNLADYEPKFGIHEWILPLDKPFRTWEEKVKAGRFTKPTYQEILDAMQLPKEEIIVFDKPQVDLTTHVERPDCRSVYSYDY